MGEHPGQVGKDAEYFACSTTAPASCPIGTRRSCEGEAGKWKPVCQVCNVEICDQHLLDFLGRSVPAKIAAAKLSEWEAEGSLRWEPAKAEACGRKS